MSDATFDRTALGFEAVKLLETLLARTNGGGRAQLPKTALARASGLSQGAITRAVTELARHRLLCVEPGYSASGLRGANVYVLNLTALEPSSVVNSPEDSSHEYLREPEGAEEVGHPSPIEDSIPPHDARKGFWGRVFRRAQAS